MERSNEKRSAHAGYTLGVYRQLAKTDEASMLSDLLTDLMHWARNEDYDFDAALRTAAMHYEHESGHPHTPYSVLLLYPDYLQSGGTPDTYYGWAEAATPQEAVEKVRLLAVAANVQGMEGGIPPEDFALLACIEGHHDLALVAGDT